MHIGEFKVLVMLAIVVNPTICDAYPTMQYDKQENRYIY